MDREKIERLILTIERSHGQIEWDEIEEIADAFQAVADKGMAAMGETPEGPSMEEVWEGVEGVGKRLAGDKNQPEPSPEGIRAPSHDLGIPVGALMVYTINDGNEKWEITQQMIGRMAEYVPPEKAQKLAHGTIESALATQLSLGFMAGAYFMRERMMRDV